jgi:hypothetical protein
MSLRELLWKSRSSASGSWNGTRDTQISVCLKKKVQVKYQKVLQNAGSGGTQRRLTLLQLLAAKEPQTGYYCHFERSPISCAAKSDVCSWLLALRFAPDRVLVASNFELLPIILPFYLLLPTVSYRIICRSPARYLLHVRSVF